MLFLFSAARGSDKNSHTYQKKSAAKANQGIYKHIELTPFRTDYFKIDNRYSLYL